MFEVWNQRQYFPNEVGTGAFGIKLPNILCDSCRKRQCTQWYGLTSVVVCDLPECMEEQNVRYETHCSRYDELDL